MGIREASRPPRSGQHPPRLGTRGKLATVASRRSGPDTRPHTTPKSEPRRRAFPLCNVSSIQCVRALVCPQNPGRCPSPAWATSQNESDGCVTAAAPSRQGTSGGPSERQASAAAGRHPRAPRSPPGAWAPARAVSPAWASRAWGCVSAVWTRGDACLCVWTACPWGCVYAAHPRQSPVSARVAGSSDGRHISLTPRGTGAPPAPGWPHWAVPRSAGRFGEEACDARQSPVCPLGRC